MNFAVCETSKKIHVGEMGVVASVCGFDGVCLDTPRRSHGVYIPFGGYAAYQAE